MQPQMTQYQVPSSTPAPGGGGGGNWFTNLAPTIGSVGGGILGTVFGGPLGGIAGAAGGGALGQGIEDAGQGKNPLEMNDVTTGLESGAGQGLGEGLMGGVGSLLGKVGGSGAVQAGSDMAVKKLLSDQLGQHILDPGANPDTIVQTLMDNGITDLSKAPQVLGQLTGKVDQETGGGGLLTQGVDYLMQKLADNGITIKGDYGADTADKILADPKMPAGTTPTATNQIKSTIDDELQKAGLTKQSIGFGVQPNLDGADPAAVRQGIRNLRDAARAQPYNDPSGKAAAMAYGKLADQMSQDLFQHPYAVVTPQMKSDMIDSLSSYGAKSPKMVANMSQKILKAGNAQDLNNAQTDLVQAIKAAESPVNKAATMSAKGVVKGLTPIVAGGFMGGPVGAAGGLGLDALGTPTGAAMAGKMAAGAPGALQAVADAMTSTPGMVLGGIPGAAAAGTAQMQPTGNGAGITNAGGGTAVDQSNGGTGGPMNAPDIAQTLSQMDQMMAADPALASSLAPQIAALSEKAQNINAAQQALQHYAQTLQQAGGAHGPLLGLLQQLGGAVTGGPAAQLGGQGAAVQAALKNAGAGPMQLPGLMSNPAGAASSLGQAQSVLGAMGG